MRGVISFILLLFLIESLFLVVTLNNVEFEESSDSLLHSLKLMDFYNKKIIIKREIQNILVSGPYSNPSKRLNFVSEQLALYEIENEIGDEYEIDFWCGYIEANTIDILLNSNVKPPNIKDFSSGCSDVLVFDNELDTIKIGRNLNNENINLIPTIGFKIKSKDNSYVDVDYI